MAAYPLHYYIRLSFVNATPDNSCSDLYIEERDGKQGQ